MTKIILFLIVGMSALDFADAFQSSPYSGTAKVIQSNDESSYCAIDMSDLVHCWGAELIDAPADLGPVKEISVAKTYACAIRTDDKVICWGKPWDTWTGDLIPRELSSAKAISMYGYGGNCGIALDGKVYCWSFGGTNSIDLMRLPKEYENSEKIYSFGGGFCVSDKNGKAKCWTEEFYDYHDVMRPPEGFISKLEFGYDTGCALTTDKTIECIGVYYDGMNPDSDTAPVPTHLGKVRDISVTPYHACAIGEDGGIFCWKFDLDNSGNSGLSTPPLVKALKVASGKQNGCAILEDHTITCWGNGPLAREAK